MTRPRSMPEWEHLDTIRERACQRILGAAPLHEIHLVPIAVQHIEVYVFYERDSDLHECRESGDTRKVKTILAEELNRGGRGSEAGVQVYFEFDSHENVVKNYEGSYFLRLR